MPLQPALDGGFIIAGRIESEGSGRDALLIKTDSSGRAQWVLRLRGQGDDIGTCAVQSSDGGYVLAGITDSFGNGAEDAWLVKIRADPVQEEGRMELRKTPDNGGNSTSDSADAARDGSQIPFDSGGARFAVEATPAGDDRSSDMRPDGQDPSQTLTNLENIFKQKLQ